MCGASADTTFAPDQYVTSIGKATVDAIDRSGAEAQLITVA
jgi:hypothetical protein